MVKKKNARHPLYWKWACPKTEVKECILHKCVNICRVPIKLLRQVFKNLQRHQEKVQAKIQTCTIVGLAFDMNPFKRLIIRPDMKTVTFSTLYSMILSYTPMIFYFHIQSNHPSYTICNYLLQNRLENTCRPILASKQAKQTLETGKIFELFKMELPYLT